MTAPALPSVLPLLESLSPLRLAADWDNTGLLVGVLEPDQHRVPLVLCTIDLTESVVEEALAADAGLVVAYHPPIFRPLTALVPTPGVGRAVLRAARSGLPIWSPHTALDAVPGGVNDWLANGLGEHASCEPIEAPAVPDAPPGSGQGRMVRLRSPAPLDSVVADIKRHLALEMVRVAVGDPNRAVTTIALCPGAGGSLLARCTDADLLWTGEMRHHDVLAANGRGQHAVLCEHTNTERGFLPVFAARLAEAAKRQGMKLEVVVSGRDRDPHQLR